MLSLSFSHTIQLRFLSQKCTIADTGRDSGNFETLFKTWLILKHVERQNNTPSKSEGVLKQEKMPSKRLRKEVTRNFRYKQRNGC